MPIMRKNIPLYFYALTIGGTFLLFTCFGKYIWREDSKVWGSYVLLCAEVSYIIQWCFVLSSVCYRPAARSLGTTEEWEPEIWEFLEVSAHAVFCIQ